MGLRLSKQIKQQHFTRCRVLCYFVSTNNFILHMSIALQKADIINIDLTIGPILIYELANNVYYHLLCLTININ